MSIDIREEQRQFFQQRGGEIQTSFEAIKVNPLNLNLLMSHVGLLSATMHDLIDSQYPKTLPTDDLR